MNDEARRNDERARRSAAQQSRGTVVPGSGQPLPPRRLEQMVSVRLDPEVVAELRSLAEERGATVSDLLREAAAQFLQRASTRELTVSWTVTGKFDTLQGPQDWTEPSATVAWSEPGSGNPTRDPLCPV